jgi:hypothetical protein
MYMDSDKLSSIIKKEEAAKENIPFVPSNDVLLSTSWLLQNALGCCPLGQMTINVRNRLEGHTDNDAGAELVV